MTLFFLAIFLAIAICSIVTLMVLTVAGDRSATEARLSELASPVVTQRRYRLRDVIHLLTRPLAPFRNRLQSRDEELAHRLALGGFRKPEDINTFLNAKLLLPVLGVLSATFTGKNFMLFAFFLAGAGYFLPDLALHLSTRKRTEKIDRALPDTMDLLVVSIEAGLGMDQAVIKIADEMKTVYPELCEELLAISREQRAGKPRIEAWRAMADRVDVDAVRQFVAMLTQTERLGTPIARALAQFADSLRTTRLMLAEERAAKTTVKLIFPLAFFIFPALFVVLLGPAMITIMQGFQQTTQ
jgi:tight adherence protein C